MYPGSKEKTSRRAFAIIVILFGMAGLLEFGRVNAVTGETNSDSNKIAANSRSAVTARAILEQELDLGMGPGGLTAKCPRSVGRSGGGRSGGFSQGFSYSNTMSQLNQAWRNSMAQQANQFDQVEREAARILNENQSQTTSGPRITGQSSSGGSGKKKTSSSPTQQPLPSPSTAEIQQAAIRSVAESLLANSPGMKRTPPDDAPRLVQGYEKDLAQGPLIEEPMVTYVTETTNPWAPIVTETEMPKSMAVATENLNNTAEEVASKFLPPVAQIPEVTAKISQALGEGDYGKATVEALKHGIEYIPGNPGRVIGAAKLVHDTTEAGEVPLGKAAEDYRNAYEKYSGSE